MKKIITKVLLLVLLLPFALTGCSCGKQNAEFTQMKVDLNPSVEFMLDKDNKVVSVTALNDDGAVVIYGEAFVGLTADKAVELYVSVCKDTGYLVNGEQTNNDLQISLTCDTKQANEIYEAVKTKVNNFYTQNNISGKIAELKNITEEDIKNAVLEAYPELENANLKKDELLAKLSESRKETQDLISNNLRNVYYGVKDSKVKLAENEKIKEAIESAGSAYTTFLEQYNTLLTNFDNAINSLNSARNSYLIDSESEYQKALRNLMDKKAELLEAKKELAELESKENKSITDNIQITALKGSITTIQMALDGFEAALNLAYTTANGFINASIQALTTIQTQMTNLKESFPNDLKNILKIKAQNIENAVNETKADFFNSFETEYQSQIESYENYIQNLKANLKSNNA